MGKYSDAIGAAGVIVAIVGVFAQIAAPNCPVCGTKLIVINNYCLKCRRSYT